MSDVNEKSSFAFAFQPVTKLFEEQTGGKEAGAGAA